MLISPAAGRLYAGVAIQGRGPGLIGGLIARGACALLGIAVSAPLLDVAAGAPAFGTRGSAVAGPHGGAVGKIAT